MYDNGLLRHYKLKAYRDGYLTADDLGLKIIKHIDDRVAICHAPEGVFFTKLPRDKNLHRAFDPEILLSQIYTKAGLTSAIYLPIRTEKGEALISNRIDTDEHIVQACNFLDFEIDVNDRYSLDFLNPKSEKVVDFSKYFTLKALQQQTKLRIYDTASFNSDRHDENYFYRVFQVPKLKDAPPLVSAKFTSVLTDYTIKADDVVSIDYELSGLNCYDKMLGQEEEGDEGPYYDNDFEQEILSRAEMLKHFRTNPYLENLVDKRELAEEIGSINPEGVARDIQETTGYQVNSQYVTFLSRSYEEVAESLMQ